MFKTFSCKYMYMFLMLSLILVQKINFNMISPSKREFSHKIALYDCFQFICFHSKKNLIELLLVQNAFVFLKINIHINFKNRRILNFLSNHFL